MPDDDLLASASSDHLIIIWNWPLGIMIRSLRGHSDIVWDMCMLNDRRYIVSVGTDGKMKVWNWRDGTCSGTFTGSAGSIYVICNVKNYSKLVTGAGDNSLKLWSYGKSETILRSKVMA